MIVIVLVLLTNNTLAFNLDVSGKMVGDMKWTAEEDLYGEMQVVLTTRIRGLSDAISANATIILTESKRDLTQTTSPLGWSFYSNRIAVKAPLLYNSKQDVTFVIGDQWPQYSRYAVWLDGYSGNKYKKGFSISDLNVGPFNMQGFYIWDATGAIESIRPRIGFGTRLRMGTGKNTFNFIYAGYRHRTDLGLDNDSRKRYGLPTEEETVFGFEIRRNPLPQLDINGIWFETNSVERQWEAGAVGIIPKNEVKSVPSLKRLTIQWTPFSKGKISFDYRDFEPGYRPRYADHRPQFHNDRYYGYNIIDLYAGQKGCEIGMTTKLQDLNVGTSFSQYKDRDRMGEPNVRKILANVNFIVLNYDIDAKAKEITSAEGNDFDIYATQKTHALKIEANKSFKVNRNVVTPKAIYFREQRENNSSNTSLITQIGFQLGSGHFNGLGIAAGVERQQPRLLRPFIEGEFETPGGINISFRATVHNYLEPPLSERWDDDFQDYRGFYPADNYFNANVNVRF